MCKSSHPPTPLPLHVYASISNEIFHAIDKVYRAVNDANNALDEFKYHLVGGAAGTVTPSESYHTLFVLG